MFSAWYPNGARARPGGLVSASTLLPNADLVNSAVNALARFKIGVVAVAFREGPNTAAPVAAECGGDELWFAAGIKLEEDFCGYGNSLCHSGAGPDLALVVAS